jgi:hypothetical protein
MLVTHAIRKTQDYVPLREIMVGDRVMRQRQVGDASKGFLHGLIVKVKVRPGMPPLYDCCWDNDTTKIDTGYLAAVLMPETFDS